MDCTVCYAHLRRRKPCPGCRGQDDAKPAHCRTCHHKECAAEKGIDFCVDCPDFPCIRIRRLDKSYRQRYGVSLIEMTTRMKNVGAVAYLREQRAKWTCTDCGGVISLHDWTCSECGKSTPREA